MLLPGEARCSLLGKCPQAFFVVGRIVEGYPALIDFVSRCGRWQPATDSQRILDRAQSQWGICGNLRRDFTRNRQNVLGFNEANDPATSASTGRCRQPSMN